MISVSDYVGTQESLPAGGLADTVGNQLVLRVPQQCVPVYAHQCGCFGNAVASLRFYRKVNHILVVF